MHKNDKTILITGAGGAIGAHAIAHILENTDWSIVATDSFRHKGYFDRITTVIGDNSEWKSRVEILTHDLTVPFSSRQTKYLEKVSDIVHLASLSDVQDSIDNPVPFIHNNVAITTTTLELARHIKPNNFILFSTDEVYGPCGADSGGHPEWSVIAPSNPYSASKAAQEAIAFSYWRSYDVPVIITNTMNNFGEMQGVSKFTAMIQKKLENDEPIDIHTASDGEIGTRYYLHSRNAADAIVYILKNLQATHHAPGEIDRPDRYNIVGDAQVSNKELVLIIAELMGKDPVYRLVDFHSKQPGHDLHYGLDGTKLQESGWKSPSTFKDSLLATIEWQKRHPEWME